MKKILEEQIRNINEELELIESPEKKVELRIAFAMLLHDLKEELPEIPEGKDAIKTDSKKKKKTTKKKEEVVPEIVEEVPEEVVENIEETFNDEELQDTGIEIQEEISETPAPIRTDIIVENVNVSEAYNKLPHDMDEDLHQTIAYYLTVDKEIAPIYEEIIKETSLSHSEEVVTLSYALYSNDISAVNEALSEFSNGVLSDVFTDLNDNNIEAFTNYISSEEEEE